MYLPYLIPLVYCLHSASQAAVCWDALWAVSPQEVYAHNGCSMTPKGRVPGVRVPSPAPPRGLSPYPWELPLVLAQRRYLAEVVHWVIWRIV